MVWRNMAVHDPDATPKALRVMNPNFTNDNTTQCSQLASEKSRRFSLRSISGSLSSIWGKESLSRSHTDSDQDSPPYGCTSFSTRLSSHHTSFKPAQKRFPIDGEDKSLNASSCSSFAPHPASTRFKIQNTAFDRRSSTDDSDQSRRLEKLPLFKKQSRRSHDTRIPPYSRPNRGIFRRVFSKVMTSNSSFPHGGCGDDSLPVSEPPSNTSSTRAVFPHIASINSILAPGFVENGEPSNAYGGTPYQYFGHSGRDNEISNPSSDTVQTSPTSLFSVSSGHQYYFRNANPLHAPPPSLHERPPSISASERSAIRKGMANIDSTRIPLITTINIDSQAFTARGDVPKYRATAYAIFNLTTLKHNALLTTEGYQPMENYPGTLLDIEIQTQISGPGVKLAEMGVQRYAMLNTGDCCTIVVRVGIREDSLASRLSTSLRSRGGSHEKSTSAVLIDHFLDVLKMDSNRHDQPVVVTAIVKYRHNFLPETTVLETRASCTIRTIGDNQAESALQAARRGKARVQGPESITDSSDDLLLDDSIATFVVRALDPGGNTVELATIERVAGQNYPPIPASEALRLLHDFREAFSSATDNPDLASLEDFYNKADGGEAAIEGAIVGVRSLRRRARGVIRKLSPRKLNG